MDVLVKAKDGGYQLGRTRVNSNGRLSVQEERIATCFASGLNTKNSAPLIGTAKTTANSTATRLRDKLGTHDRAQTIIEMHKRGWITHLCIALCAGLFAGNNSAHDITQRPPQRPRIQRTGRREQWAYSTSTAGSQ